MEDSMARFPLVPPIAEDDALRDVFREQYADSELPVLFEDIKRGTDRTVCILLSAMVERCIERLILAKITFGMSSKFSKTRRDELFDRDGPLSTFGGNIKLAWSLDLISGNLKAELNALRKIRNKFAHSAVPLSLSSPEIRADLHKMRAAGYFQADFLGNNVNSIEPDGRRDYVKSCLQIITDIVASEITLSNFKILIGRALEAYEPPESDT
jgi:hypothetical protein